MEHKRIRDWMEIPGRYLPGKRNAITDVPGVLVGHRTVTGENLHTGVTLIRPHEKDPYRYPTPCALAVGNGFGKLTGSLQVEELGCMESYIGLTNTFSVSQVMQGILNLQVPTMTEADSSMNVLVGETNDSYLSDMRTFPVTPAHVEDAYHNLSEDVEEGAVGAGTGTICFGHKGGIGTASGIIPADTGNYVLGALVQTNFGGHLNLYGRLVDTPPQPWETKGSCMIVIATNAPVNSRQLKRIARRGLIGMTNTGSYMGNGSGDFCIAFSNYTGNLFDRHDSGLRRFTLLPDDALNPFFSAAVEAVQESVYNSMSMSGAVAGVDGHQVQGLDVKTILGL